MDTIETYANKAENNWKLFREFSLGADRADYEGVAIFYTHNRDSDLLAESNAAAIEKRLQPFVASGDVWEFESSHWVCGWVAGYAIRVYNHPDEDGLIWAEKTNGGYTKIVNTGHIRNRWIKFTLEDLWIPDYTPAFLEWYTIQEELENYPVLDEDDFCERESNAHFENVKEVIRHITSDLEMDYSTDEIVGDVVQYLYDKDLMPDDPDIWPEKSYVIEALHAAGYVVDIDWVLENTFKFFPDDVENIVIDVTNITTSNTTEELKEALIYLGYLPHPDQTSFL